MEINDTYTFAIISFFVGIFIGVLLGFLLGVEYKKSNKFWATVISFTVFALWTASVTVDLVGGQQQTSVFLHLFFGTILGLSNPSARDFLLDTIGKIKK